MTWNHTRTSWPLLAAVAAVGLLGARLQGAVSLSVSPAAVSNTYSGPITLDIAGLSAGQSVVVQKYLDANTNNLIDAGDWLVQQFPLADGQLSVIGGATNINIPGDLDSTPGSIRAQVRIQSGGVAQKVVGRFAFRVSSPGGLFTPITNLFTITNSPLAQSFTGSITCSGTNVPYGSLFLFPGTAADSAPSGGVIADAVGNFTYRAEAGTHMLLPFKAGFVADMASFPVITLNPGATVSTNLTVLPATGTISGRFVNAGNPGQTLPGILVVCESQEQLAIGFTDPNGNFSVPVRSGQWQVSYDTDTLMSVGYLAINDLPSVDTSTGSVANVTVAFPKGTALIYGSIKDDRDRAVADVPLWASDNLNRYEGTGRTDADGNYAIAVTPGTWHVEPDTGNPSLANYVFSWGVDVALSDATAVRQDFRVLLATNHLSGSVKNAASQPVAGVGVYAWSLINSTQYNQHVRTSADGSYRLNLPNGTWNVGLSCGGNQDSLDTLGYQCVSEQSVVVANNNPVLNFTVQPCGSLQVVTTSPLPNAEVSLYYTYYVQASGCYQPFNWTLAPGSTPLPPGLNLWANGNLEGIPTTAGTYSFTVRVTDNRGGWAERAISLTVNPQVSPLQVLTSSLANSTAGAAYNQQLFASGGQPPYSWSLALGSGDLPPGLSLAPNGVISGIPSAVGQFYFTVQVTDAGFATATRSLSIRINPRPVIGVASKPSSNQFLFQVAGAAGQTYTIQASPDLSSWLNVRVTNPPVDTFTVLLERATNNRGFYRVLVGP